MFFLFASPILMSFKLLLYGGGHNRLKSVERVAREYAPSVQVVAAMLNGTIGFQISDSA